MARPTRNPTRALLQAVVEDPQARPRLREQAEKLLKIWPPTVLGYENAVYFLIGLIAGLQDHVKDLEDKLDGSSAADRRDH